MEYETKDKVVLVTGAAEGIGAGIVKEFLENGAKHVAMLDINEIYGPALEEELADKYGKDKVQFINCDVSKEDQLFDAFDKVETEYGYIDVVVNNAGLADETLSGVRKEIEVNFTASVMGTIKAIEIMRKDRGGKGGTVINISSITALNQVFPIQTVYAGTKSAILQFSNCLGMEGYYSTTNVRIVVMCFGATKTTMTLHSTKVKSFDPDIADALTAAVHSGGFALQSIESAARGTIEAYKKGESGSTWAVVKDRPAVDITPRIKRAYEIMSEDMF